MEALRQPDRGKEHERTVRKIEVGVQVLAKPVLVKFREEKRRFQHTAATACDIPGARAEHRGNTADHQQQLV